MNKDFSIIFPSRDRLSLLINLLKSIKTTTFDTSKIEVLVAIDGDDLHMTDQAKRIEQQFQFVKFYTVKRSVNFSQDYYSYLAKQSTGKWVIACNDDAEFVTDSWDIAAETALRYHVGMGKNIIYGWIEDLLGENRLKQFGDYCCFPLLGRDGIEASGNFFSNNVPIWGADIHLFKLYKSIGRVVKLPMTIKHLSHHNGLRERDELNIRVATENAKVACNMVPTNEEVNVLIQAVKGN